MPTDYSSSFSRDPDGDLVAVGTSAGNWATLTDTHGDLVAAFTTAGTLTDSRSYDPFGEPVVAGNPAVHVGFQGSWTDPDTDRVSAQARWYTPGTGTFARGVERVCRTRSGRATIGPRRRTAT